MSPHPRKFPILSDLEIATLLDLNPDSEQVQQFCQRWRISELELFGSVLREDFSNDSDVDVLVTFTPEASWSLLDHVQMQTELSEIFGRNVDLIIRRAAEQSPNWLRRKSILESTHTLYSAAIPNNS